LILSATLSDSESAGNSNSRNANSLLLPGSIIVGGPVYLLLVMFRTIAAP
jgi:hypothetical protein